MVDVRVYTQESIELWGAYVIVVTISVVITLKVELVLALVCM